MGILTSHGQIAFLRKLFFETHGRKTTLSDAKIRLILTRHSSSETSWHANMVCDMRKEEQADDK